MARKADVAAAKQRQQRMILIVLGVLFVGLLAFQGPKLMKQLKGNKSTAAPPVTTTPTTGTNSGTPTSTPTTNPYGGTTSPAVATAGGPSAKVAGVVLRPAGLPTAGTGQLWSLSRFKAKDPFVQQVQAPAGSAGSPVAPGSPSSSPTGSPTPSGQGTSQPGGVLAKPTTTTPTVLGYATLLVNGKAQQLQLKQLFPKNLPTFVLLGVGKGSVKIGVAGGKFTDGSAVKLLLGKPVTLMNTTTGQRFVMKLVFTGASPEQIAGFKAPTPAASGSGATTTTTKP